MRTRIISADIGTGARMAGLSLGVCLAAAMAPAHAQTANGTATSGNPYYLRGTTTGQQGTQSNAASTLYGALPASTSTATIGDEAATSTLPGQATSAASALQPGSEETTGAVGAVSGQSQADLDYASSLGRQNDRVGSIDQLPLNAADDDSAVPGFAFGSLTLRPTLAERVVMETVRSGGAKTSRTYSETTLSGTLNSDWSRHSLSVEGSGTWQKNISGTGEESPSATVDARLRLDLIDDFTATLGAGYSYSRESRTDPNAIANATTQSGVHELRASVGLEKSLGLLRGTSTLELTRNLYGNATLANGGSVTADDRDTLGLEATARIGYAVSPALIPFLEASASREKYDQRIDSTGAQRSSTTYGLRAGMELDLGEKLSGEFAAGYLLRKIDDPALSNISGLSLDGTLNWSPQRGTDVSLGVTTTLESATAAGQSGAILYELNSSLTQQIHSDVVARLSASAALRDYDTGSGRANQQTLGASAGLTWSINRYLDLDLDASYQRVTEAGQSNDETMSVGLGLKLRR